MHVQMINRLSWNIVVDMSKQEKTTIWDEKNPIYVCVINKYLMYQTGWNVVYSCILVGQI